MPFIVVGGLAVVAHGYGRQTQDIALVVNFEPGRTVVAFAALASLGYRPIVPVAAYLLNVHIPSVLPEGGRQAAPFHLE